MELGEILQILWKRVWLIVLGTVLSAAVTVAATMYVDPVYEAKVTLMVNQTAQMPTANLSLLDSGERLAQTYSLLLKTRPLLEIVIANLDLDLTPEEMVRKKLNANVVPGTQLIEVTVKDTDPQRASDIANEVALTFVSMHSAERQLDGIIALEQNVDAEIVEVRKLIAQNRLNMDRLSATGLLSPDTPSPVETTLSSQQSAYATLLGTYLSVQQIKTQLLDLAIVEPAVPPIYSTGLAPFIYVLMGAFAGFSIGVGVALLWHHLDRSFENSEDVSSILALPTLGTIPQLQGKERRNLLSTSTEPYLAVSEAYRVLRTNIRFASVDRSLRTMLVTSAEPSAGKSTVASNLGIACAQAGLRVVIVDADLRRPNQHRLFGLSNANGLTDLLVGDVGDVEECMVETEVENLRLIPSGSIPPNPSELVGSNRMEIVLDEIKERADLVIVDSPPVLAVADPVALGRKVDGTLLVIRAKRTSHSVASKAYNSLSSVGATVLGVVLLGTERRRRAYYYYYPQRRRQRNPATRKLQVWAAWLRGRWRWIHGE